MQVRARADVAVQARFYRGLADPSRLALLTALRGGERTVGDAAAQAGISLSTASRHLACLKDCGLVEARPDWRYVYYTLAEGVAGLLAANEAFVERVAERVAACRRPEMGDA
jgi:DNA-binding transcriptional ArsR family regulator